MLFLFMNNFKSVLCFGVTKALSRYLQQSTLATTEISLPYMTIHRPNLQLFYKNYYIPSLSTLLYHQQKKGFKEGIAPGKTKIQKQSCTTMFIAALFTIAWTWKQSKCPSSDEWIKKMWHIYTMEYYSAIKKK